MNLFSNSRYIFCGNEGFEHETDDKYELAGLVFDSGSDSTSKQKQNTY